MNDTPNMGTPKKLQQNEDNDGESTSLSKIMDSPKTPVRAPLDDSMDDYETDEMESPQFPHLIPIYHKRNSNDYDLEGVRIGWDDGYGSVCYQDDDYGIKRNGRSFKRNRSGGLFTERRNQSMLRSRKTNYNDSPSPIHCSNTNNVAIQAELNDYLGCILNCLSAKKRNRQLLKSQSDTSSTNNSTENNNVRNLLNDSADDEMMMLCSQAIEKTIASDANYTKESNELSKSNFLSIVGISPLKDFNSTSNNNVLNHATKKFKLSQCKQLDNEKNENFQTQCYTVTSNAENTLQKDINNCSASVKHIATDINKDSSLSLLEDSLANDDDLFSALDLSAIEQEVFSGLKEPPSVTAQKCNITCRKLQENSITSDKIDKNTGFKPCTISSNNTSTVLWRRSTSHTIVNNQLQTQSDKKTIDDVNEAINSVDVKTVTQRYCTPAEIEAKRDRARRTLMLKFKSKNRSAL